MLRIYQTLFPAPTTDIPLYSPTEQSQQRIADYQKRITDILKWPAIFVSVDNLIELLTQINKDTLLSVEQKISLLNYEYKGYRLIYCVQNNTSDRHPHTLAAYLHLIMKIHESGARIEQMLEVLSISSESGFNSLPTHLTKCVAEEGHPDDLRLYLDILNRLYSEGCPSSAIFRFLKIKRNNNKTLSMAIAKWGSSNTNWVYLSLLLKLKRNGIDLAPLFTYAYDQSYAQNIMLYQSDELALSVINADILTYEEYVRLADSNIYGKERIYNHISQMPPIARLQMYALALNKETPLGRFFHIKRGFKEPSIESGFLKLIHDDYTALMAKRSDTGLNKQASSSRLFDRAPSLESPTAPSLSNALTPIAKLN